MHMIFDILARWFWQSHELANFLAAQ